MNRPRVRPATAGAHTTHASSADQRTSGNRILYSSILSNNKHADDTDDLSNDKLLDIYFEAVDALQKCRNKYDKLRVLGMMLRHAL